MRIGDSIYMDYQASTPVDPRVASAMIPYATEIFANPHASQYSLGQQAHNACISAQSVIAEAIGAMANEIVFTSGATEANNQAVAGVLFGYKGKRNKVLISAIEHKCVKEVAAFYGKHLGYHIEEIPVLSTGEIDPIAYSRMLTEEVLLVSVMAVNNEIGTVQQVAILAEQAHNVGALVHCDAAQAADAVDIDVMDWELTCSVCQRIKCMAPKVSVHYSLTPLCIKIFQH